LTGSTIYTIDNISKELTNCEPPSLVFSKLVDEKLLSQKHDKDTRTDKEFLEACEEHVENKSDKKYPRLQRANALVKLLGNLKNQGIIFMAPKPKTESIPVEQIRNPFTEEEMSLVYEYKAFSKYEKSRPGYLDSMMPNKAKQQRAQELIMQMESLSQKTEESECQQSTNANPLFSNLVGNLVSHLTQYRASY
jgi:hypothetical protein